MAAVELVTSSSFRQFPWLRHGFSTRHSGRTSAYGGSTLNLGWTKEDVPENVTANRAAFVDAVSGPEARMKLVTVRQVHSNKVLAVGSEAFTGDLETDEGKAVLEADGLTTNTPGVLISAGTADCVPVLMVDPVHRAVAALHAGWRGTVAGIVRQGVNLMQRQYGSSPEDLVAAVGPSIGTCCYSVGDEVRQQFVQSYAYGAELFRQSQTEERQLYVNLWMANRRQLLDAGLRPQNVTVLGECTGCARTADGERKYFSHRMESGLAGRMLSSIGIANV